MAESGKIDVLVHNAGHMMFGPAEAFLPEQFAVQYDVNVLGTQRLNRAVLPHMRAAKQGLLLWISSSSSAGGTPPYLAPYFAAKAAMDSLAVLYARELSRWGIETTIVVPGAFTKGTNHFAHSGRPADEARVAEYEAGPYKGFGEEVLKAFAAIVPDDAEPSGVADEIVKLVDMPFGKRPFRIHYDLTKDRIDDRDQVEIADDFIDDVDRTLIRLAASTGTTTCTRTRSRWCSTSSVAVPNENGLHPGGS